MRCTHAEKLIPLFAGDDLPAREANALRRHLESCANCRRLAAEFEESRKWLRGFAAPQFDEAMLDDLRGSVLKDIGRIENRARWIQWIVPGWNPRFAASMVALLLIAFLAAYAYHSRHQRTTSDRDEVVKAKQGRGQNDSTADGKINDEGFKMNPSPVPIQRPPRKRAPRNIENPAVEPVRLPEQVIAQAPFTSTPINIEPVFNLKLGGDMVDDEIFNREMTRIEFQTTDPNVRIIWLTPKDSNTSTTKPNTNTR